MVTDFKVCLLYGNIFIFNMYLSYISQKKCIETFQACKKMEDKSIESVYYCMEDQSMSFINQTSQSLGK